MKLQVVELGFKKQTFLILKPNSFHSLSCPGTQQAVNTAPHRVSEGSGGSWHLEAVNPVPSHQLLKGILLTFEEFSKVQHFLPSHIEIP